MRVAEKAKSKGGFLTWRGEAEKSCDRRKKKKGYAVSAPGTNQLAAGWLQGLANT